MGLSVGAITEHHFVALPAAYFINEPLASRGWLVVHPRRRN
jgi:hypothetical protein